jgi:outer membrane protein assembly factor BamE (lipoprotein component of BamABCDE complex)
MPCKPARLVLDWRAMSAIPLRAYLLSAAVILSAAACAMFEDKQDLYLKSAQGHASRQDVQQRLGKPLMTAATQGGGAVWVYHVVTQEAGAQDAWSASGSWCDEYVLTFDKQGILRGWNHRSERHGGETVPLGPCVSGGYDAPKKTPSAPYAIQQFQ